MRGWKTDVSGEDVERGVRGWKRDISRKGGKEVWEGG